MILDGLGIFSQEFVDLYYIEDFGQYLKTLIIIQLAKFFLLLIYFIFALYMNPKAFDTFF